MWVAGTSASSFDQEGGSTVKIAVPTTYHAGDLLVVAESANQATTGWSAPSGWTLGRGGRLDGQDLNIWWKVASRNEPRTYLFGHSEYADGGMVMVDFANTSATTVPGVSTLGMFDNLGQGNVSQVTCGSVGSGNAASLLILGWQATSASPNWPAGYKAIASATDGFSYVAAGVRVAAAPVSVQTVQMNPAQDAVLTLQIAFR